MLVYAKLTAPVFFFFAVFIRALTYTYIADPILDVFVGVTPFGVVDVATAPLYARSVHGEFVSYSTIYRIPMYAYPLFEVECTHVYTHFPTIHHPSSWYCFSTWGRVTTALNSL